MNDFAPTSLLDNKAEKSARECNPEKMRQYTVFYERIRKELLSHPVVVDNKYSTWFAKGQMSEEQLKAFFVQFSVFSNLFIIAQLKKVLNADTLEGMQIGKEILMSELGVPYLRIQSGDDITFTIEGGTYKHRHAHFEVLLRVVRKLGLGFADIGKASHGSKKTLYFCNKLEKLYGHQDPAVALAASFAIENWANAGFWKDLIRGVKLYNINHSANIPTSFFTMHDTLEEHHARHTEVELSEDYFSRDIDDDQFIRIGNEMLDAVHVFWKGLDQDRKRLA